jgi:hypothetical protein
MKYENEVSPTGNENIRSDGFFAIGVMVSSFVGSRHCKVRESGVDLVTVCPKCSMSIDLLGEDFTAFRVPVCCPIIPGAGVGNRVATGDGRSESVFKRVARGFRSLSGGHRETPGCNDLYDGCVIDNENSFSAGI